MALVLSNHLNWAANAVTGHPPGVETPGSTYKVRYADYGYRPVDGYHGNRSPRRGLRRRSRGFQPPAGGRTRRSAGFEMITKTEMMRWLFWNASHLEPCVFAVGFEKLLRGEALTLTSSPGDGHTHLAFVRYPAKGKSG